MASTQKAETWKEELTWKLKKFRRDRHDYMRRAATDTEAQGTQDPETRASPKILGEPTLGNFHERPKSPLSRAHQQRDVVWLKNATDISRVIQ